MKTKLDEVKAIERREPPIPFEAYARIVSPLPPDEGGGFLLTLPDLPGVLADGETEGEAIANGRDAYLSVVSALMDMGREVPAPEFSPEMPPPDVSGRFVTRLPKTLHARLFRRARAEGVSLNTLVISMIAEGLGRQGGNAGADLRTS
jgi:antitoxin HicB